MHHNKLIRSAIQRTWAGKARIDESPMDFVRRAVSHLNGEYESLLDDLPTPVAVLEFFALLHTYGVDYHEGLLWAVRQEGADQEPYQAFCKRWSLTKLAGWEIDPIELHDGWCECDRCVASLSD